MSRAVKMLLEKGWITRDQYDNAMVLSARHGETPGYHLVKTGAIADDDLVDFFIRYYSMRFWPLYKLKQIPLETIDLIGPRLAKHLRVLPVMAGERTLTLGLTDPSLTHVVEEAAFHTKRSVTPVIISETDMTWALEHYYGITSQMPEFAGTDSGLKKQAATLERETHDLIKRPPKYQSSLSSVSSRDGSRDSDPGDDTKVVQVTEEGWGIDEYEPHVAGTPGRDQEAIPLLMPAKGRRKWTQPRLTGHRSIESDPSAKHFIEVGMHQEDRITLPPPAFRPSQSAKGRASFTGMPVPIPVRGRDDDTPVVSVVSDPSADRPLEVWHSQPPVPADPGQRREEGQKESGSASPSNDISKKSISQILGDIHRVTRRDEIIDLAIDYLLLFSKRAAFLIIKQNEIRGFDIKGEDTHQAAIKSYWVPLTAESTFRRVALDGQIHLGPFGRTAADAVFAAALGGRPHRVLLIPVDIHKRVVGLLYADNLRIDMPPWNLLERLAEVVGASLARLILNRDKR